MIKSIVQGKLKNAGKNYTIDTRIPETYFYGLVFQRFIMRLRGLLFCQKPIFLGKSVVLKNKKNIVFGKNVTIENHSIIDGYASEEIVLGDNVKIGSYSKLLSTSHMGHFGKGLKMGNNSAIGDFTHFGATGGLTIGNDVIMGSYISFHSENHNYQNKTALIREQGVSHKGITIGNNVWVGAKVTFLDGSQVGDNCVVAAGAVVNGIFPNDVVIGGVPAKILKSI